MTNGSTPTSLADGGDPSDFGVDQVNEYLASLDPNSNEYLRVLAAEEDGKARTTILGAITPTTQQVEAAEAVGGEQVDVVLRHHWTAPNGTNHLPGAKVTVDALTASTLTNSSYAVAADEG